MAPHACEGPIGGLATLHVDAAMPNFLIQEICGGVEPGRQGEGLGGVARIPGHAHGGRPVPAPEKPGLGFELTEAGLGKVSVRRHEAHGARLSQRWIGGGVVAAPAKWALILGSSSGFGEAVAVELAGAGYNIYGVHLDRRETLPHVAAVRQKILEAGREAVFFNMNAADDEKRREVIDKIRADSSEVGVLLHSLAFGALRPLVRRPGCRSCRQLEMTSDVMGHSHDDRAV